MNKENASKLWKVIQEAGDYLQNKLPDEDDGSLSWALLKKNVRYINVETRLGYLTQQKKILSFIEKELN